MTPIADPCLTIVALTIVDSTLREGEQYIHAFFTSEERIAIAQQLDAFGIDVIELPSPRVSPQTEADIRAIAALGLRARTVCHVRCVAEDVDRALDCGVDGLHLFFGTSPYLRAFSHGQSLEAIREAAVTQVRRVRAAGRYVRFSAEDAFRTALDDLFTIFDAVVAEGVDRIGLPDTVGIATPRQVAERIAAIHAHYPGVGIEFHGHNDTGCAVANALAALEGGADCIDTTILGIGERNGIASLSGLIAGIFPRWRHLLGRYNLRQLASIDGAMAAMLGIAVPFNQPITGEAAFAHRAGIHTNAVLRDPTAYEALDPAAFGLERTIDSSSRLIGQHAIRARAATLGIALTTRAASAITTAVKTRADAGPLSPEQVDALIRVQSTMPPAVD